MKDTKDMWNQEAFAHTPVIIRHEYRRLYQLLEKDKNLYAALLQIKDVLELLLKFGILSVLASMEEEKREKYTYRLLGCSFSLGQWKDMGVLLLKEDIEGPLGVLLAAAVSMYQKHQIVRWRNEEIGHGCLGFAEDARMQQDIADKVQVIAAYFEETMAAWQQISLEYNGNVLEDLSQIKEEKGTLWLHYGTNCCSLQDFFWCMDTGIYLYDDYHPSTGTMFVMDYNRGKKKEIYHKPFYDLYLQYKKRPEYANRYDVHGDILMQSQDTLLKKLAHRSDYVKQPFLMEWLKDNLDERYRKKGILLLRMERGTGKSAFCHAIDGLLPDHLGVPDTTVRCYYARNLQQRSIKDFVYAVNNLFYQTESGDRIIPLKGTQPQALSAESSEKAQDFARLLNYYNRDINAPVHKTTKTLFVIDGVDEAICKDGSIFDYLPFEEELEDGVFILLTCRTDEDRIPLSVRNGLGRTDISCEQVFYKEKENASVLKNYIRRFRMKKDNIPRALTQEEIEKLMELSHYRFLEARLLMRLLESGRISEIQHFQTQKSVIGFYLEVLEQMYGEKMYQLLVRLLSALTGAYEPITLYELGRLCGESHISVQIEAILQDIESFLLIQHTDRGNVMMLANEEYARYVREHFEDELSELAMRHLQALNDLVGGEDSYQDDYMTYLHSWWEEICFSDQLSVPWKYVLDGHKALHNAMHLMETMMRGYSTDAHRERLDRIVEWMVFLTNRYKEFVDVNKRIWCYSQRGNWYYKADDWNEAKRDLQFALLLAEKHEDQLNDLGRLGTGRCHKILGDYYRVNQKQDEAISEYQKGEKILSVPIEGDAYHYVLSAIYNNQAISYRRKKNYAMAEALYHKSMQEDEQLKDADKMTAIYNHSITLNALAVCLEEQQKDNEAEQYYRQAIHLQKQLDAFPNTGWRYGRVVKTYSNYGDFLMAAHRYAEAEEAYQNACQAAEKVYQYDKTEGLQRLASACFNIAYFYGERPGEENAKKCIAYYDKCVQYRTEQIAKGKRDEYESLGSTLNNRAVAKNGIEDLNGALEDYLRAHEAYEEAMWNHTMTDSTSDIRTLNNISLLFYKKEEKEAGWNYLMKAEEEWLTTYLEYRQGSFSILEQVWDCMESHMKDGEIVKHMEEFLTMLLRNQVLDRNEIYIQNAELFIRLRILYYNYRNGKVNALQIEDVMKDWEGLLETTDHQDLLSVLENVSSVLGATFTGRKVQYTIFRLRKKYSSLQHFISSGLVLAFACEVDLERWLEEKSCDSFLLWKLTTSMEVIGELKQYLGENSPHNHKLEQIYVKNQLGLFYYYQEFGSSEAQKDLYSGALEDWLYAWSNEAVIRLAGDEQESVFLPELLRLVIEFRLNQAVRIYRRGNIADAREQMEWVRDHIVSIPESKWTLEYEKIRVIAGECDFYLAEFYGILGIPNEIEVMYSPEISSYRYLEWLKAANVYVMGAMARKEQIANVKAVFLYLQQAATAWEYCEEAEYGEILVSQIELCYNCLQYFLMYQKSAYVPQVFSVFKKWIDSQGGGLYNTELWTQCKKMVRWMKLPF